MNFSADSKVLASGSNHLLPIDITYETTDPYVRIPPQTNADTFTDSNYLTWEVPTSTNWTTKWNKSYFHIEFEVKVSKNGSNRENSRFIPMGGTCVPSQGFLHDLFDDLTIQGAGQSEIRNINASSGSYQFASKVLELLETNSRRVGGAIPRANWTSAVADSAGSVNNSGTTTLLGNNANLFQAGGNAKRLAWDITQDCPNPFVLCLSPDLENSDAYLARDSNLTEIEPDPVKEGYLAGIEYRKALIMTSSHNGEAEDAARGGLFNVPYRPKDGWFSNPIGMFNNAPLRIRMRRGNTQVAFTGSPYNDYKSDLTPIAAAPAEAGTYRYEVFFTRFDLMLYRHQLTSTSVNTIKQNILQAGKVRYPIRYVNAIQRPVQYETSNFEVPLFESSAADLVIVAFIRNDALTGNAQRLQNTANIKYVDSFKCAPLSVNNSAQTGVPGVWAQQRVSTHNVGYQLTALGDKVDESKYQNPAPFISECYLLVDGVRTYNQSYTSDANTRQLGDPEGYLAFIREVAPHYPDLINYFSQANWDNNIRLFAWNLTTDGEMIKNQGSDLVNRKQIQLVTKFAQLTPAQNTGNQYTMVSLAITNQAILEADAAGNLNLLR